MSSEPDVDSLKELADLCAILIGTAIGPEGIPADERSVIAEIHRVRETGIPGRIAFLPPNGARKPVRAHDGLSS